MRVEEEESYMGNGFYMGKQMKPERASCTGGRQPSGLEKLDW
jgi:hypothetical protein